MRLAVPAFLVAVAYAPGLPSAATYGRWAVIAGTACFLVWYVHHGHTLGHKLGAAFLIYCAAGLTWTVTRPDTAGLLFQVACLGIIFCYAAQQPDVKDAWEGFALGVAANAVVALGQHVGISPVWNIADGPVGLFVSKNMAMEAAVLALVGAVATRQWLLVPPAAFLAMASGSRAAVLVGCLCAVYWAFTHLPHKYRMLGASVAMIAFAGFGLALFDHDYLVRSGDRLEIWMAALSHVNVWGDGLGSFALAFPGYEHGHNQFVHFAFELGIGSMLLWGVFGYALSAPGHFSSKVGLVAILSVCLVWSSLLSPAVAFMGAVLAGHLCGVRGRADALKLGRRTYCEFGTEGPGSLGVGAMVPADIGRCRLPVRPKHPLVPGPVRPPLE